MKSVVQVTGAVRNIKDLEDFPFAHKATLTGIIMVSRVRGFLHPGDFGGLTGFPQLEVLGGGPAAGVPEPHLSQFCFDPTVGVLGVTFLYLNKGVMAGNHSRNQG